MVFPFPFMSFTRALFLRLFLDDCLNQLQALRPLPAWPEPFIEVHDWGGRVGRFRWLNSEPSPHQDLYSRRMVAEWGGCDWSDTPPECMLPFTRTDCLGGPPLADGGYEAGAMWAGHGTRPPLPFDPPLLDQLWGGPKPGSIEFWLDANKDQVERLNRLHSQALANLLAQIYGDQP
jgi:hypothetical protein